MKLDLTCAQCGKPLLVITQNDAMDGDGMDNSYHVIKARVEPCGCTKPESKEREKCLYCGSRVCGHNEETRKKGWLVVDRTS